jgi:hypothetical protein
MFQQRVRLYGRIGITRKVEVVVMNYIAILVAAVAAFVASSVYYVMFGKALTALLPAESVAVDMRRVPAWKKAAEFVRGLDPWVTRNVRARVLSWVPNTPWRSARSSMSCKAIQSIWSALQGARFESRATPQAGAS